MLRDKDGMWLTCDEAGELIGRSGQLVRTAYIPEMESGDWRKGRKGVAYLVKGPAVIALHYKRLDAAKKSKPQATTEDELLLFGGDSGALEEYRTWKAMAAQADYYREINQLLPLDFWKELDAARFDPIRRWAEAQIKAHGNGTEASYREAVEQARAATETVLRRLPEPRPTGLLPSVAGCATPAAPDAPDGVCGAPDSDSDRGVQGPAAEAPDSSSEPIVVSGD
jgi:hypothetical protein